jgi:DNA-binding transcriptional MerR regulator
MRSKAEISLAELSAQTGVSGRTIRLYISQGLLPGPIRAGRNAAYTEHHVALLEQIRELQEQGMTLTQARRVMTGEQRLPSLPEPASWRRYVLAPDVEVVVREGGSPWRNKLIQDALATLNERLKGGENRENEDDEY